MLLYVFLEMRQLTIPISGEFVANLLRSCVKCGGSAPICTNFPSPEAPFNVLISQAQLGGEVCWPRGRPLNSSCLGTRSEARTEKPSVP